MNDNQTQTVRFRIDRTQLPANIADWECSLHIENDRGECDILMLPTNIDEQYIFAEWVITGIATQIHGKLCIQLCFEDKGEGEAVWFSNIATCKINPGIKVDEKLMIAHPQLFIEWEREMEGLREEVRQAAERIENSATILNENKEQIEGLPELLGTCEEKVQSAASSAQEAKQSEIKAENFKNTMQGHLTQSEGFLQNTIFYSTIGAGHSQAAQSAKEEAVTASLSAKAHADNAKAIVGFSPHNFIPALTETAVGEGSIHLTGVQPNTPAGSLVIYGKTLELGTGDPSPGNPYTLQGVGDSGLVTLSLSDGGSDTPRSLSISEALHGFPSGVKDEYDLVSGKLTKRVRRVLLGDKSWGYRTTKGDYVSFTSSVAGLQPMPENGAYINMYCDKLFAKKERLLIYNAEAEGISQSAVMYNVDKVDMFLCIAKSRLPGWDDAWGNSQKSAALQTWLEANPITVLHELATPVITDLVPVAVSLDASACTISVDDVAAPTMQIRYHKSLPDVIQSILEEIQHLKNKPA